MLQKRKWSEESGQARFGPRPKQDVREASGRDRWNPLGKVCYLSGLEDARQSDPPRLENPVRVGGDEALGRPTANGSRRAGCRPEQSDSVQPTWATGLTILGGRKGAIASTARFFFECQIPSREFWGQMQPNLPRTQGLGLACTCLRSGKKLLAQERLRRSTF